MPDSIRDRIVDAMHDAVICSDTEGIIRLWNGGAEKVFGFAAAEALGSPLDMIIPERFRGAHDHGFRQAVATGHLRVAGKVLTTRATHKDGRRLYVDFSFGLVHDEAGAVTGVFAVGRDVTQRQLAQAAAAKG